MKKFFLLAFMALASLVVAGSALAAADTTGLSNVTFSPPNTEGSFQLLISKILNGALGLLGVVALVAFIWAGVLWMTSGGDATKITKAKKTMIWAVAGLVIIFAAFGILTLFFNALGYATPTGTG